ncbi:protein pangolin, isoforms A/H/I/S isoform X2 [Eurytemora carolleeae]|uniref:protein pangolin, isoforms A/H/I/S isoform X2 n=1 Tax=Eurytemora carolleeae TaxID=1294199 RepID=UPI000C771550|nr:protein pangolin, isoforms A/H/I/S isoform X2 [Eurytemora carolleeae]|eukprot:XP_023349272.1 protein pangolin, isoforms A/H/I/S-like isoform X2 [Eurytemora affinis]
MPGVSGNVSGDSPDEFCSSDEVKVFKDEGEDEQEQNASECLQAELLEEKSSLITESEQGKSELRRELGHTLVPGFPGPFGMGYLVNPYAAYANSAQLASRGGSPLSPFLDPLGSPPPAHMGSLGSLSRPSLYPIPSQYPYPTIGMDQLAAWHYQGRGMSPYSLAGLTPTSLSSPISRFSPGGGLIPPHPDFGFSGFGFPPGFSPHLPHIKQEYDRPPGLIHHPGDQDKHESPKKKEPHIKKPLNAFMLYMKEMRPVVQAECTLKESAAINQILGRRWHSLARADQARFYELARQERLEHNAKYPQWTARDNYAKRKKKRRSIDKKQDGAASMKKCRARYGLDQQNLWCKPCRRKKKCIRVQMYLAGRTEQEIEATQFDEDGEAIPPLNARPPASTAASNSCSSNGSDGEGGSPASQVGSIESSEHSIRSPATPGGGLSIPSIGSPASIASPATPGTAEDWFRHNAGFRPPAPNHRPVGTDPRDSKNPLSISSLTSCHSRESGHDAKTILGVT